MSSSVQDWEAYFNTYCHLPAAAICDLFEELDRLSADNKQFRKMLKIERNLVDEVELQQSQIRQLRDALEGWMLDHGDRCRICMDRSQAAIKGVANV